MQSVVRYVNLLIHHSTTFVKHFMSTNQDYQSSYVRKLFIAGYCNTTTAIDGVQFKMIQAT